MTLLTTRKVPWVRWAGSSPRFYFFLLRKGAAKSTAAVEDSYHPAIRTDSNDCAQPICVSSALSIE